LLFLAVFVLLQRVEVLNPHFIVSLSTYYFPALHFASLVRIATELTEIVDGL
jgi:hypothetical protein